MINNFKQIYSILENHLKFIEEGEFYQVLIIKRI